MAALAAAALAAARGAVAADARPSPCQGAAPATPAWPKFCSIPPSPQGVRTPAEFHAAVLSVREAGAHLERQTSPSTFTLTDTEGFAAAERHAAAPPPPMAAPGAEPTESFVEKMRARATPPRRSRHRGGD